MPAVLRLKINAVCDRIFIDGACMEFARDNYVERLLDRRGNDLVKVITGIRRSGKSYLLDPLLKRRLLEEGVSEDHIIKVELDRLENRKFHRDPLSLGRYLRSQVKDKQKYYLLLDEVQLVSNFELLLNGLLYDRNFEIYVTGSNSKFLSTDIITEFRGRGDQVYVAPLSFAEYHQAVGGDKYQNWEDYQLYGGLPQVLAQPTALSKIEQLNLLFNLVYFPDLQHRYHFKLPDLLERVTDVLASAVGSLTNPQQIYNALKSAGEQHLSLNTVGAYLEALEEAFVVKRVERYDIRHRRRIHTPQKFYFTDLGLRSIRLNFRQYEPIQTTENALYNELINRGYQVDAGMVETREQGRRVQNEVDFVCERGSTRLYLQCVPSVLTREQNLQASRPLNHISDSFSKFIVVNGCQRAWLNDDGMVVVGVVDLLLEREWLRFLRPL